MRLSNGLRLLGSGPAMRSAAVREVSRSTSASTWLVEPTPAGQVMARELDTADFRKGVRDVAVRTFAPSRPSRYAEPLRARPNDLDSE